jgi:prenylcysteine oxidase/farnesylcysteine lyase
VCLATDGAVHVKGGNWQIFSHFAEAATAEPGSYIHLNTTVEEITNTMDGRWKLSMSATDMNGSLLSASFDEVIVAGPFQYSNLRITPELEMLPDTIPYVELHVTLFTSPHLLAADAFNLPPDAQVPLIVLTTLHPSEKPGSAPSFAGKAGFFSISMLRPITNPNTKAQEYLYKIFSPEPVSPSFLARILGLTAVKPETIEGFAKDDVSWLYKKVWNSYPVEYPRVTFEKAKLAPGLWYTGGIESFISTMETSALMGKNVAQLIADGWLAEKGSETGSSPDPEDRYVIADGTQKVLKAKL